MILIPEQELGVVLLMNGHDPTQTSAFSNIGFDVALLALGLEAQQFLPQEDMISRHLRQFAVALIFLLLTSAGMAVWRLRSSCFARRDGLLFAGLAIIDLALVIYILFIRLPSAESSVRQTVTL